jgi:hypothetical protein
MSVNTHIYLQSDVRGLDVAKAIAVLAGLPVISRDYGWTVQGITSPMIEPTFELKGSMIDGEDTHRFYVHYESDDFIGHDRLIMPPSTAFWVAIGRRLIEFFGGVLIYQDCASLDGDEHHVRSWHYPQEADDEGCFELSARICALQPLSRAELESAEEVAYYPNEQES